MGVAASMGVVIANVVEPSSAAAATADPILAWSPFTAYRRGQQVISPNNDVASASVAHTSSATYAEDTAKWTLSSTYSPAVMVAAPTGIEAVDSASTLAALMAAAGNKVGFRPGIYVLNNIAVTGTADIVLDPGTTLLAKPNMGDNPMFNFTGTKFKMRGGTVDGNKANQSGRPYIFAGAVQAGKSFDVADVAFQNTVRSVAYISRFGGNASIERCTFTGQAEHDGVVGHFTSIMAIIGGQGGAKGLIRFNENRAIGTTTPALVGGHPGGIFLAVNGYVAGAPGTDGFANGNLSTLEAIGNHFYGYGQNCSGNDISPIHCYPAIDGARVVGNYFEACGLCAISAKSVQDFICTDNVIVNGLYSAKNVSSAGAISYMPGYQAGTFSRPRAVISGNIITDPGGESVARKQYGIAVHGQPTSFATDVVIANNVITRAGKGIQIEYGQHVTISNNIVVGATGGANAVEDGMAFYHMSGDVHISGNEIRVDNGNGILCDGGGSTAAKFFVHDNHVHTAANDGIKLGGVALAKLSGNTFNAITGSPVNITADRAAAHTAWVAYDQTNTVLSGVVTLNFSNIDKATGFPQGTRNPQSVVVPGEVGTMYRKTGGGSGDLLFVSLGVTSTSWATMPDSGSAGAAPSIVAGTGAGTSPTVTQFGNDAAGRIRILTGTKTVVGAGIAVVKFSTPRASAPNAVILTPANGNAATVTATGAVVYGTRLTTGGFSITNISPRLTDSTTYEWYYHVI